MLIQRKGTLLQTKVSFMQGINIVKRKKILLESLIHFFPLQDGMPKGKPLTVFNTLPPNACRTIELNFCEGYLLGIIHVVPCKIVVERIEPVDEGLGMEVP
eukprot:TRINITY_DN10648_c0_g1_i7.p3 TRINITY_DN10648_c0_g1~~TRINITY_DN10648_c0_g1_i7.p3  ORF type:complete len:101 (-),score=13.57 TRINITY_DN10648_c0_g1_i7:201-503(-)